MGDHEAPHRPTLKGSILERIAAKTRDEEPLVRRKGKMQLDREGDERERGGWER